jgi:hypothetical protein
MSLEFPEINGQKHTFADVIIAVNSAKHRGITKIDYGVKRAMNDAHGTGPNRVGVAIGKVTNEGSMEMYRADLDALLAQLGDGYTNVPLQITVIYRTRLGAPLITDTLNGVRISEIKPSASEGDEPVKASITLNVGGILLNGKRAA